MAPEADPDQGVPPTPGQRVTLGEAEVTIVRTSDSPQALPSLGVIAGGTVDDAAGGGAAFTSVFVLAAPGDDWLLADVLDPDALPGHANAASSAQRWRRSSEVAMRGHASDVRIVAILANVSTGRATTINPAPRVAAIAACRRPTTTTTRGEGSFTGRASATQAGRPSTAMAYPSGLGTHSPSPLQ